MEISGYQDGLAFALTNPVFWSPLGYLWRRTEWKPLQQEARQYMKAGIIYNDKIYYDVEHAYKSNKILTETEDNRLELMVELMTIKLKTYPKLVEGIKLLGGLKFLEKCTHQPTKKNSIWESGGENQFIKCLCQAYKNVTIK